MAQKTARQVGSAKAHHPTKQEYPEDRFDRVLRTGRVGAHRVTVRPRYVWQYLIAGLLGFALLTTIGVFAVQSIGGTGNLPLVGSPKPTSAPEPRVKAELDPSATVAVLNGSTVPDLAAALDTIITQNQWGTILFSGSAVTTDVEISAVFYMDKADEAAAEGLAAKLGGISTYFTTDYADYGARLVVLIGSDYAGPGLDDVPQPPAAEDSTDAPAIDPETGYAIDPETGLPIDPATGELVEPAAAR